MGIQINGQTDTVTTTTAGGTVKVTPASINATGLSTFSGGIQVGATTSIVVGSSFIRSNAIGIGSTTTTGRNAGIGTVVGTLIYNATTSTIQFYGPTGWFNLASTFSATGGTKTTLGSTTIHTFNSTDTLVVEGGPKSADYLIVAGGGGGNNSGGVGGAGGGAGGFRTGSGTLELINGTYTISVGAGGARGESPSASVATRGVPSFISSPGISSITSIGGGAGAGTPSSFTPGTTPGGSGGGGTHPEAPAIPRGFGLNPSTPAPELSPFGLPSPYPITQGNNGADATDVWEGGGGGGAGGAAPTINGGPGSTSSISGSPVTYAGGGGGGRNTWQGGGSAGSGGPGGGGPGGNRTGPSSENPGTAGTANRGGGGGGGGRLVGAAGGSGIVIISYPT